MLARLPTPCRVDLTLRSGKSGGGGGGGGAGAASVSVDGLEEGQVVRGRVRRLAAFGVFVEVDGMPGVSGGWTGG